MPEQETNKTEKLELSKKIMLTFSLQMGLMVAIPLLVLSLLGKWLSVKYGNPAFLYGGVVVAVIISTAWTLKKIKNIYNDFIK